MTPDRAPGTGVARAATPVFGALRRTSGPPSRARRTRWMIFLLTMLGFTAYPVDELRHAHLGPSGPAVFGVLLAGHAVLWVRTMWLALAEVVGFRAIRWWLLAEVVLAVGVALVLRGSAIGMLIYASIACAVSLPLVATLPAIAAATLVSAATLLPDPVRIGRPVPTQPNAVFTQLSFVFFLGLMMLTYRRSMLLIIELHRAREDLARLAVTEERLRFARDLHDLLGHSLSTIALKSQLAQRLAGGDPATAGPAVSAELADIRAVAAQALAEVREAVTGYRGVGLAHELDSVRSTLAAARIEVTVRIPAGPLPAGVDALLGWVVREAATNVLRHSHARTVRIDLRRDAGSVRLEIADDGVGPGPDPAPDSGLPDSGLPDSGLPGSGLSGMVERLAAAGGTLRTGAASGGGFVLVAQVPMASGDGSGPGGPAAPDGPAAVLRAEAAR